MKGRIDVHIFRPLDLKLEGLAQVSNGKSSLMSLARPAETFAAERTLRLSLHLSECALKHARVVPARGEQARAPQIFPHVERESAEGGESARRRRRDDARD